MEIYTPKLVEAFKQYRVEVAQAVQFNNPDYSHSGVTRERARRVAEARSRLVARTPDMPSETLLENKRPGVLSALAPTTADQVAVQGREWAKVQAILGSGRVLESVVLEATTVGRLTAILDNVEIWAHGKQTNTPEKLVEKINGMVFDRLVEVGHPAAVAVVTAEKAPTAQAAWHGVLTEALTGEHTVESLGALQRSDPEGYADYVAVAQAADPLGDVNRKLRALDSSVGSGSVKVG